MILNYYRALISPDIADSSILKSQGCDSHFRHLAVDHVKGHYSVVRGLSLPTLRMANAATRDTRTDDLKVNLALSFLGLSDNEAVAG